MASSDQPRPLVVGGAGGTAAVVSDVDVLGQHLARSADLVDEPGLSWALARAGLDAQATALLVPAASAQAGTAAAAALVHVTGSLARARALAAATQVAAAAYADAEAGLTAAWHEVTLLSVTDAGGGVVPVLLVVAAGLHEIGGDRGVGTLEAAALEMTLDGAAQLVDPGPLATPSATPSAGVVEPSALQRVTGSLAAATPPARAVAVPLGPQRPGIDPLDSPPEGPGGYHPATAGLAGLVDGVADASRGEDHVVAVRHRRLSGPDGAREAYVVDLPGTDDWDPLRRGGSVQDVGSDLRQLGDRPDDAYVEAVLDVLTQVPAGVTLVLVGHSLGGVTAARVAAEAARRGRQVDYVVAAGSPVDTTIVPAGTTTVSLQNGADLVPSTDGRPAHDVAGRTTVTVVDDRGGALANHSLEVYQDAARAADAEATRDPGLRATTDRMRRDGATAGPGDVVEEEVTWWRLRRTG